MSAPIGNKFWKLRSKHGRDKLFATPLLLWEAACEYFEWCENTPLLETRGFAYQGIVTKETFPKMRAMTMEQLCFYLHCSDSYFRVFKSKLKEKDEDFLTVITDIETTIRTQKFQGASADLLNANIISRDLGLMDKSSVDMTTDLSNLSEEQLNYIANKLIKEQDGKQNR